MEVALAQIMQIDAREKKAFQKLLEALHHCDEPTVYECLKKREKPFQIQEASQLCRGAIFGGCSVDVFREILAHSSALLEELVDFGAAYTYVIQSHFGNKGGLVQEAAAHGRGDILQYLLDQGCSPNARRREDCSALEAALKKGSAACVSLLEQREDVDFTITKTILEIWGNAGKDPEQDACFRIAARRLLGEDAAAQELPLLPGMTVVHAANCSNWPLVRRLCRERTVTAEQGKEVVSRYVDANSVFHPAECARLLDALFAACDGLLRCEYPRYILAVCMLSDDEEAAAMLKGWVERLPGRAVTLCGQKLGEPDFGLKQGLRRWEERMGTHLQPVLRRSGRLPARLSPFIYPLSLEEDFCLGEDPHETDGYIRLLLERCQVRGKLPAGKVSALAKDILQRASPGLVRELIETGKVFPEEDCEALLESCRICRWGQEKRNVILAYCRKNVNYEL